MKHKYLILLTLALALPAYAVVLPPSDDTTTITGGKSAKGTAVTVQVGGKNRGWVQFDLNQLPLGTTSTQVSKAILRLYPSVLAKDSAFSVSVVDGAWTERALVDATAPAVEPPELVAVPLPKIAKGSFVNLDITAVIQGWLDNPGSNHGLVLSGEATAPVIGFDSKENAAAGHYPQLDITLSTVPGTPGPKGDKGDKGDPGTIGGTGLQGATGEKGDPGATGQQGLKGDKGDTGATGAGGAQGPAGAGGSDFIYGDGSAGAFVAPGGETTFNLSSNPQFTTFEVPASSVLHIPSGTRLYCTGSANIAGKIVVDAGGYGAPGIEKGPRIALYPPHINLVGGGGSEDGGAGGGGSFRLLARGQISVASLGEISAVGEAANLSGYNVGGGGGGIVILASASSITTGGLINVAGGKGGDGFLEENGRANLPGGGGGGGLIRLLAPAVGSAGTRSVAGGNNGTVAISPIQLYDANRWIGGACAGNGGYVGLTPSRTATIDYPATDGVVLIDQCNPAALLMR